MNFNTNLKKIIISFGVLTLFTVVSFNIGVNVGHNDTLIVLPTSSTTSTSTSTKQVAQVVPKRNLLNLFIDTAESKPKTEVPENIDMTTFWQAWNAINEKYVTSKMPTDEEKMWGATKGLLGSLNDPYSTFFTPDEGKMFNEDVSGSFGGVGMDVGVQDGVITVIAPLKGTPAEKAGILAGDQIISINDKQTYDMGLNEAVGKIRGTVGTNVKLIMAREGKKEPLEFNIIRSTINIPIVDSELRKDGVYVIHFYSFSENSANVFETEIEKFKASGSKRLLIDLRNNPGGYLDAAINISSLFMPGGKIVVRESFGEGKKENEYRATGNFLLEGYNYKAAILMNKGSASASEILAGALSEHNIATLIGEKSYGKGSVQEVISLDKDTSMKLTIAKWLTPNGISISEKGLTPDVEVKYVAPSTTDKTKPAKDNQLEKAVEVLLKK
jgi:carboxyl-terminal processing protease